MLAVQAAPVEIVVTGRGLEETAATPAYGSVTIDRERLISTASNRLEDALADVAGLQAFRRSDSRSSNPSAQGLTLRALGGNATSRTLVLLDGVPVADPFFGYIPLSALVARASVRGDRHARRGVGRVRRRRGRRDDRADQCRSRRPRSRSMANSPPGAARQPSSPSAPRRASRSGFITLDARWDRGTGFWTTPKDQRVAGQRSCRLQRALGQCPARHLARRQQRIAAAWPAIPR